MVSSGEKKKMVSLNIILISVFLSILFFVLILFWNDISSFFFPQNYASITILESDNNIRTLIKKKTEDLRFEFNGGKYNLFEAKINMLSNINTSIYRKGRLGHFFFIEGNENPLDLRNMEITGNPQLNEALLKQDLSKLWEEPKTPIEQFMKYLLPIIVVVAIAIVLVMIIKQGNPTGIPEQVVR